MASGIINLDSTKRTMEGRIEWESSSNGAEKNTSNVTARLQVRRNDGYTTKGTWTGNLQIDNQNQNFSLSSTTVGNDWVTMKEFTIEDKQHNQDGSGNCYIYGKVNGPSGTSMSGQYVEGGEDVTLDTIERYLNITAFEIRNITINTAEVYWQTDEPRSGTYYYLDNGSEIGSATYGESVAEDQKSGTFIIKNLLPNIQYSIKLKCVRADNGLATITENKIFSTYNIATLNSAPSFNIGETPTVTWNNPSGCKLLIYAENIVNGEVESQLSDTVDVTNQSSYTYSLNAELLYSKIPNSNSGIIRYVLCSENDGKKYYSFVDSKYNVINSNPEFNNWTYADVNDTTVALTGDNQKIINGYSNVKTTVTVANKAIAKNYATMVKYRTIIGNLSDEVDYSSSEDVSMQINNVNNTIMNVYAIDSRGNSTSKSISNTFIDYSLIYISSILVERQQGGIGSEVKLTYNGYIWNNNFGKIQNAINSIKYFYRLVGTEEWKEGGTKLSPTLSGNSFSQSVLIQGDLAGKGFNISNAYEIKMIVSDKLTTSKEISAILGQGIPLIAYHKNGVAFGELYNPEVGGPIQVDGKNLIKYLISKTYKTDILLKEGYIISDENIKIDNLDLKLYDKILFWIGSNTEGDSAYIEINREGNPISHSTAFNVFASPDYQAYGFCEINENTAKITLKKLIGWSSITARIIGIFR